MWFFKKKKIKNIYKVAWKFSPVACSANSEPHIEIVKAYDIADAWTHIKAEHGLPITLVSYEEFCNGAAEKVT